MKKSLAEQVRQLLPQSFRDEAERCDLARERAGPIIETIARLISDAHVAVPRRDEARVMVLIEHVDYNYTMVDRLCKRLHSEYLTGAAKFVYEYCENFGLQPKFVYCYGSFELRIQWDMEQLERLILGLPLRMTRVAYDAFKEDLINKRNEVASASAQAILSQQRVDRLTARLEREQEVHRNAMANNIDAAQIQLLALKVTAVKAVLDAEQLAFSRTLERVSVLRNELNELTLRLEIEDILAN